MKNETLLWGAILLGAWGVWRNPPSTQNVLGFGSDPLPTVSRQEAQNYQAKRDLATPTISGAFHL